MLWRAQYGRWDFVTDAVGFIASDTVLTICIYLNQRYKVCTCPANQLPFVQPHSVTRTHISRTRIQQSLHSRTINQCSRWPHYEQPRLLDSQRLTLVASMEISFIRLFFVLCWRVACVRLLLVSGCCPSLYATLWTVHVSPSPFRDQLNRLISLCRLLTGFATQISLDQTLRPFTKGFLNGRSLWNFWRMASDSRQLKASSRLTWLTNDPEMVGYTV
jgi:hypothetical protein